MKIPSAPTSPPIPYFFSLSEAKTWYWEEIFQHDHHNDNIDDGLDGVDEDLIEGDIEQGAGGKTLQDGNGQ